MPFSLKWSEVKPLARKVTEEFDETIAKGSDLSYKFTGKDSTLFCHKFIPLITFLSREGDPREQRLAALAYTFIGLNSIFHKWTDSRTYQKVT